MQKARAAEAHLHIIICQRHGLSSGLVRRIQVAAVQAVALYGAELCWRGQRNYERGVKYASECNRIGPDHGLYIAV
jgi:hypothetical protein